MKFPNLNKSRVKLALAELEAFEKEFNTIVGIHDNLISQWLHNNQYTVIDIPLVGITKDNAHIHLSDESFDEMIAFVRKEMKIGENFWGSIYSTQNLLRKNFLIFAEPLYRSQFLLHDVLNLPEEELREFLKLTKDMVAKL